MKFNTAAKLSCIITAILLAWSNLSLSMTTPMTTPMTFPQYITTYGEYEKSVKDGTVNLVPIQTLLTDLQVVATPNAGVLRFLAGKLLLEKTANKDVVIAKLQKLISEKAQKEYVAPDSASEEKAPFSLAVEELANLYKNYDFAIEQFAKKNNTGWRNPFGKSAKEELSELNDLYEQKFNTVEVKLKKELGGDEKTQVAGMQKIYRHILEEYYKIADFEKDYSKIVAKPGAKKIVLKGLKKRTVVPETAAHVHGDSESRLLDQEKLAAI